MATTYEANFEGFILSLFKDENDRLKDLLKVAEQSGLSAQQMREAIVKYLKEGFDSALTLVVDEAEKNELEYDLEDLFDSIKRADIDNDELLARLKDFDKQLTAFKEQQGSLKYEVVDLITALPKLLRLDIALSAQQVEFEQHLDQFLKKMEADGHLDALHAVVTEQQQLLNQKQMLGFAQKSSVNSEAKPVLAATVPASIPAASRMAEVASDHGQVPADIDHMQAEITKVDMQLSSNKNEMERLRGLIISAFHNDVGSVPAEGLNLSSKTTAHKFHGLLHLLARSGLELQASGLSHTVHPYYDDYAADFIPRPGRSRKISREDLDLLFSSRLHY